MQTLELAPPLVEASKAGSWDHRPSKVPTPVLSVLHLINGEHFSGAERVQQLLGKQLPHCAVDADFVCLKPGKFAQNCDLPPERVFSVPMNGRLDRDIAKRVGHVVQAGEYDLLHAHTPRSAMIASRVASRLHLPWIYHVHSPTARDSSRRVLNQINDLIERWSLRNCSMLITVSRSLRREFLRRGIERQRLVCIPNGVPALPEIDRRQRLNSNSWKLGMVALFRPRKGLEVLLDAMRKLPSSAPRIEVEIIGGFETQEYEQTIHSLVREYNLTSQLTFTGFTQDVAGRLNGLDGLVLPSLYGEGMPMVVLEALSAAVPVIATRVEGTPEVVRDGVEGILAEPRNSDDLCQAIQRFVADRSTWYTMSQNAVKRHRERYSDAKMAQATSNVYRRIVSNRPGQPGSLSLFCG